MRFIISVFVLSNLLLLSSCQEKVQSNNKEDIIGFWEGEITVHGKPDIDPQYVNLLVKKDGTVTNEGQWFNELRINVGTWELKGNAFKYQVSNVVGGENPNPLMGTAILDPSGKLIDGIWQNLSGSNSGTFEMTKRK
ncbi:MAG: hypothetical protein IPI60_03665 [Saprospiraceae bacterium]|nr:hypothetical protein [Saprospiraceae bacterium]